MARTLAALILAGLTAGASHTPRVTGSPNTVGMIRGRVVINGAPAATARVQARLTYIVNGERRTTPAGASATTNNDGFYELAGLKPGEYVVSAEPEGWDLSRRTTTPVAMQPTLHPSATDLAAAHPVRVHAGGTADGIDVNCVLNTPFSISARIVTSDGKPGTSAVLRVQSIVPFGIVRTSRIFVGGDDTSKLEASGSVFWIGGLPAGRYELTAVPDRSNPGEWARADVTLGGQPVTNLVLTLERGMTATGRVVFRSHRDTPIPDPSQLSLTIAGAADTITGVGVISQPALSPDFTFSTSALRPGRYGVQIRLPDTLAGTWSIESTEISDVREAMRCCWLLGVPFDVAARKTPEPVTVVLTDRAASLSGVVTDRAGRPSPAGVVTIVPIDRSAWIQGSSRMPAPVRPDLNGRYEFAALPPGDYHLTVLTDVDLDAWRFGIWPDVDTAKAVRVSIASGEQKSLAVSVGLPAVASAKAGGSSEAQSAPAGSISGRVALVPTRQNLSDVRAFRAWTTAQGERRIGGPPGGFQAQFDGMTGEYQIRRLPPGDYVVVALTLDVKAVAGSGIGMVPPSGPVFHPAALDVAAAEIIRVEPAAEVIGIDISPVDRPWSTIEGRVVDVSGKPAPFAQVDIALASMPHALRPMLGLPRAVQNATGSFVFRVPPGRYIIAARGSAVRIEGQPLPSRTLQGQAEVNVSGFDVNNVVIRLEPGTTVSGRVTFVGSSPPPDLHDVMVRIAPAGGDPVPVIPIPSGVNPDGRFSIDGVAPGRYSLDAIVGAYSNRKDWWLDRAVAGGEDTRDRPLEIRGRETIADAVITFTDRPTELICTLQDASGAPISSLPIAVVPTDPSLRRLGSPRFPPPGHPAAADGRFVVRGLPPGDYLIFALADLDADAWKAGIWPEFNPAAAVKVSISAGEKKIVAVRISR